MILNSVYQDSLKRQLELVKINQEKQRQIELRDYKIAKLEQELRETRRLMLKLYESNRSKNSSNPAKITLERISIYG